MSKYRIKYYSSSGQELSVTEVEVDNIESAKEIAKSDLKNDIIEIQNYEDNFHLLITNKIAKVIIHKVK